MQVPWQSLICRLLFDDIFIQWNWKKTDEVNIDWRVTNNGIEPTWLLLAHSIRVLAFWLFEYVSVCFVFNVNTLHIFRLLIVSAVNCRVRIDCWQQKKNEIDIIGIALDTQTVIEMELLDVIATDSMLHWSQYMLVTLEENSLICRYLRHQNHSLRIVLITKRNVWQKLKISIFQSVSVASNLTFENG